MNLSPDDLKNAAIAIGGAIEIVRGVRSIRRSKSHRDDINSLKESLAAMRGEMRNLQTDNADKNKENRDLKRRVDDLESANRQLASSTRETETANAELRGRISEQREFFTQQDHLHGAQILQLRADISQRDAIIVNLNEKIATVVQSSEDKARQLAQANATIAGLEEQVRTANAALEELASLRDRVGHLEQQIKDMARDHEAELAAERADKERIKGQLAAEREEKDLIVSERDSLRRQVFDLRAELAARTQPMLAEVAEAAAPETPPAIDPLAAPLHAKDRHHDSKNPS